MEALPPDPLTTESGLTESRPPTRRSTTAATWLGVLVVISAWIVLELWGLGAAPFHTKGEPREGLVVWEMTHGGGWILPKRNGTELPSKPPLFHWLGAATSLLRGVTDEWSIRFPSALTSLLGALGVFAAGTALWGPLAGLVAALSLMTTFEWARAATNARVDMTLTVGLEAAFLGFLFFLRTRRPVFLMLLYLGIAFAALGKGPVGIVLPGAVALATIIATRDFGIPRQMRLVRGALVVALIAGSWYVLASQVGGSDFVQKQILNENIFRFIGGSRFSGGHQHSNVGLFGLLLLGLMPWMLFVPHTLLALWVGRRQISFRGGELYCIVWIAVVCGFYALVASKRSVYLLALYPAVALLLGWWWNDVTSRRSWRSAMLSFVGAAGGLVFGVILSIVALQAVGFSVLDNAAPFLSPRDHANVLSVSQAIAADPRLTLACLGTTFAAMLIFGIVSSRGYALAAFGSLFVGAAAIIVAIRLLIMPAIARQETLREFMVDVREAVGPADVPFFYKTFDYGAVFYWQGHLPTFEGSFPVAAPRFLLMSRSEWEQVRAGVVNQYEQVRPSGDDQSGRLVLLQRHG